MSAAVPVQREEICVGRTLGLTRSGLGLGFGLVNPKRTRFAGSAKPLQVNRSERQLWARPYLSTERDSGWKKINTTRVDPKVELYSSISSYS